MRIHLIGICGTAMATLAVLLKQRGHAVRGSDEHVYPPMSELLREQGIELLEGYRAEHVTDGLDLVVIGNAVSRGNEEVETVLDRRLRYASLPEVVRNEFLWQTRPVVVSGTHGKTTTAFLVAWLLDAAGGDPSFLVGGISRNFATSGRLGTDGTFVIEGDEYDSAFFDKTAKFLKYLPEVVVVNNLEFDHADIYRDLDELRVAFRRLVRLVPRTGRVLLSADDTEAESLSRHAVCPVETFGFDERADWRITGVTPGSSGSVFDLEHQGSVTRGLTLPMLGRFNVRNAVAALAAASAVGSPVERTSPGLAGFAGVRRRLEVRGEVRGVTVYDDFAHHPTAVAETLAAVRTRSGGGRIWAIFEPRSATACRRVFQADFAQALSGGDEVVLAAVHRREIPDDERLSEGELVAQLRAAGVSARFIADVDDIVTLVATEARTNDQVVIMSNGGFGGIHGKLLARLAG